MHIETTHHVYKAANPSAEALLNQPALTDNSEFHIDHWRDDLRLRDVQNGVFDAFHVQYRAEGGKAPDEGLKDGVDPLYVACTRQLLNYLEVVAEAIKRPGAKEDVCMMPSRSVDLVWHAWIETAPENYKAFCERHFGAVPRHIENTPTLGAEARDVGLMRTWFGLMRQEGQKVSLFSTPELFTMDKVAQLPGGWTYGSTQGEVFHHIIGADGKPDREFKHWHNDMNLKTALKAQLVSREEGLAMQGSRVSQWWGGIHKKPPRAKPQMSRAMKGDAGGGSACHGGDGGGGGCGGGCGGG